jgi:hypothetical protein
VITRGICRQFLSPFARTRSCWCCKSVQPRCSQVSLGWGRPTTNESRSALPTRRISDSIGSAGLSHHPSTVQAYAPVVVDVRVEHLRQEPHARRLRWILLRELQFQFEESPVPCSAFWSLDEGSPVVEVALFGGGIDAFVLFVAQFLQVANESLFGWIAHIIYSLTHPLISTLNHKFEGKTLYIKAKYLSLLKYDENSQQTDEVDWSTPLPPVFHQKLLYSLHGLRQTISSFFESFQHLCQHLSEQCLMSQDYLWLSTLEHHHPLG